MQLREVRVKGLVFVIDLDAMTAHARMLQPGTGWIEVSMSGREVIDLARRERTSPSPSGEPEPVD